MNLPFVSRARFEDAQKQIEELKASNAQLLELALAKAAPAAVADRDEDVEPQRPHRKLGAQLRTEFRAQADERAKQLAIGVRK